MTEGIRNDSISVFVDQQAKDLSEIEARCSSIIDFLAGSKPSNSNGGSTVKDNVKSLVNNISENSRVLNSIYEKLSIIDTILRG